MRTTLDIADDILDAVRAIAKQKGETVGTVLSDLARTALEAPRSTASRNGIPQLPVRHPTTRVTLDHVNALRDEAT